MECDPMATSNSPDTDRRAAGLRKDGKRTMQRARLRGIGKMRKLDLTAFTQRLAAMLDAGLPLVQCMDALSDQTATPEFKAVVRDIGLRIEGGDSFAEALERYHELFGDLYVSMIRSGEICTRASVPSGKTTGAPFLRGIRSMPQIGHCPGVFRTTKGCMPQVYSMSLCACCSCTYPPRVQRSQ